MFMILKSLVLFLCLSLFLPSLVPTVEAAQPPTKTFKNSVGIEFVLIPAGKFMMGSPQTDLNRVEHEGPQHEVTLSRSFYLSKFEITQSQWAAVMGTATWQATEEFLQEGSYGTGDDYPVYYISYGDVQKFLSKLKQLDPSLKYRLPTEAEWEYSARAGTTTRYSFGDSSKMLGDHAWFLDNSSRSSHPVGQKKPNPWGLFDMHGNVWEWISDLDAEGVDGYLAKPQVDPTGSAPVDQTGEKLSANRRKRGGSWWKDSAHCRTAVRGGEDFQSREDDLGFRLLLEIE
jgi:formylglycine-generating enzyme required for sulfatase activity